MYGTERLFAQWHSFWLSALLGCSRVHIGHPAYSSSGYHDGFWHSPPLSQACFRQLDAVCPASSKTGPIQDVPKPLSVAFVLLVPSLLMNSPDRKAYCNTCRPISAGSSSFAFSLSGKTLSSIASSELISRSISLLRLVAGTASKKLRLACIRQQTSMTSSSLL